MPKQDKNRIRAFKYYIDRLILKFLLRKCLPLDNIALAQFNLTVTLLIFWCQFNSSSILTPRYFTESVAYNLSPFNFGFKVVFECFLIDLNRTTSILLTLKQILSARSKYERYFKSLVSYLFIFLIELLKFKRFVSSANWWTLSKWDHLCKLEKVVVPV